jgi:hypothetical protein
VAPFWVIQEEMKVDKLRIQEMILDDITYGFFCLPHAQFRGPQFPLMKRKIKFYIPLTFGETRDRKYWNILVQ